MAVLIVTLILSFLMVSTIKYRSFKDLKFRGRQHITYLVWGILALVLVAAWPEVMLFVMFAGYALLGPVERAMGTLVKLAGKPKREQAVGETKP
jgi:CDP-diacylglycerol--serine O-phosphatidyltransferase